MKLDFEPLDIPRIVEIEKGLNALVELIMGSPRITEMEEKIVRLIEEYRENPEAQEALKIYIPILNGLIVERKVCRRTLAEMPVLARYLVKD